MGALVLFAAYTEDIKHFSKEVGSKLEGIVVTFDLSNPYVVVGLLIEECYLTFLVLWECKLLEEQAVVIEVEDSLKFRNYEKKAKTRLC